MSLLILSGDISLNPGPIRYQCGICGKAVRENQQATECEECEVWFHQAYLDINDSNFKILEEHPSYVWLCCNCGLPSFSSSLFLSDITTSNWFDTLSDLTSSSSGNPPVAQAMSSLGSPLQSSSPSHPKTKQKKKVMRDNIKLININCQSISSKRDKFLALIEDENPDVVVGTESWLTSAHNSGEVFLQQYQVFRKDRLSDAHGGVFIAAKNDLVAVVRDDLSQNDSELLWIQIQTQGSRSAFVGAFYRPPSSDEAYVENFRASLEKIPVQDN